MDGLDVVAVGVERKGSVVCRVVLGPEARAAVVAAGGTDNGGPGLRPEYHPTYYGAFALDPDGNNVEAVHHGF